MLCLKYIFLVTDCALKAIRCIVLSSMDASPHKNMLGVLRVYCVTYEQYLDTKIKKEKKYLKPQVSMPLIC